MIFGMVGIPFMLSVLADVGGLMAEGIEYTWLSNRDRLRLLAEKLHIFKPRYLMAPWCGSWVVPLQNLGAKYHFLTRKTLGILIFTKEDLEKIFIFSLIYLEVRRMR